MTTSGQQHKITAAVVAVVAVADSCPSFLPSFPSPFVFKTCIQMISSHNQKKSSNHRSQAIDE